MIELNPMTEANVTNTKFLQEAQPKKDSKFKLTKMQIKTLVKQTLSNSFAQAIIALIDTQNKILKIFLFLCVILSSSLAAYLVIELIITYLTYPVLTSTRTLFETPTLFPKITICNQNPFITQYAFEFVRNRSLIISPKLNIFDSNQTSGLSYISEVEIFRKINGASLQIMNSLSDENRLKLAHSIDDMIAFCSFNSNYLIQKLRFLILVDRSVMVSYHYL